jgi:hypothetical protein
MIKFGLLFAAFISTQVFAGSLTDSRVCGVENIKRSEEGVIIRSASVLRNFQKLHPCPSTGKITGSCPGWAIDHVIPLACGGCDSIENLQWMKNTIKSCAGTECKDRWERKIYCEPMTLVN